MSESFLESAKQRVLVDNTGQTVFKNLRRLEDHRFVNLARWIWELLQNARDAADGSASVDAFINVETGLLRFAHGGRPFDGEEIAHLVYHGSTKQEDLEAIGQYGTGFLATHLINLRVRVRGVLRQTEQPFDFILSREGATATDLTTAMDRSWLDFLKSVGTCEGLSQPLTTTFEYPLVDSNTTLVVEAGIDSLTNCAPYVLALNPKLRSIELRREGAPRRFCRDPKAETPNTVSVIESASDAAETSAELCVVIESAGPATVAVLLRRDERGLRVVDNSRTPRLFLAFPLVGTEDFPYPAVINSESFSAEEGRDGIPLGSGQSQANSTNKRVIEAAADALVTLLRRGIENRWTCLHVLGLFRPIVPKGWIDPGWLTEQLRALVDRVVREPIVRTQNGKHLRPEDCWIPVGDAAASVLQLTIVVVGSADLLPESESVDGWSECVESWSGALKTDLEHTPGSWTLRKLAEWTSAAETLDSLQELIAPERTAIDWLNALLELIVVEKRTGLLDDFDLLPDEEGDLRGRSSLKRDPGIDAELKCICADLGASVSGDLLHGGINSELVKSLLDEDSEERVLNHALAKVKPQSDAPRTAEYRRANVSLFSWLIAKKMYGALDGYPALTEDVQRIATLDCDADVDDRPLAPVALWPAYLRSFAALFPARHILSAQYAEHTADEATWAAVTEHSGLLASPLYDATGVVKSFVPGEHLHSDNEHTHESIEPCPRTRIAFLSGDEVGILNIVRSSKPKATLFLEMLIEVVSNAAGQLEPMQTECDCGEFHNYFPADWIAEVGERPWIPMGTGRREKPTADSLALLIHQSGDVAKLLQNPAFSTLMGALGISVADVTLRSLASSEEQREALVHSFAAIVEASGGDPAIVSALAEEVKYNPLLLEELEAKRHTRERVAANKALGDAVERALKAKLGVLGLTVTRTGVGSDYEIETDILENGEETWFRLESGSRSFLLEVKATRIDSVRMTRRQGETAVVEQHRFALCVVELDSDIVNDESVDSAMFVVDVGSRIEPLHRELGGLELAQRTANLRNSGVEVVMTDSQVRFRVSMETWRQALGLDSFVAYVVSLMK